MLREKFKAVLAVALATLGLKELPKGDDGKLALDDGQEKDLKQTFSGENYNAFLKVANEVLAEEAGVLKAEEAEKNKANELLASIINGTTEEGKEDPIEVNASKVVDKVKDQQATIDKLMNEPEADVPTKNAMKKLVTGTALVASLSSSTHLFGTMAEAKADVFAFEERNWNKRAAGKTANVTNFDDVSTITRLNNDLKDYQVKNPEFLRKLYEDHYGLPEFWPKKFGVLDRVSDGVMSLGSVTQARKPDWTPGLELFIDAEIRRIYRIQIDKEFNGYQLQELETSWLNSLFNFDGSTPYKHSFIAYLLNEISVKARQEDREGAVNGIYAPNIAGVKMPGHYINAQSGIRHDLFRFIHIEKKIVPYVSKIGKFNAANAYTYAKNFVESLPLAIRKKAGMVFYMSPSNLIKVKDAYKKINSLNNDYSGNNIDYVEGYPNIRFYGLQDLEGSNLMFITDDQNIEIREYLPQEKEKYSMEQLKRDTYIHADYRFGCGFVFSGVELPADSSFKGIAQMIWVNDEAVFPDTVSVPLFGRPMSAAIELNYNRLHVHPELVADVKTLTGLPAGTVLEIIGDATMKTNAVIKKKSGGSGNLDLDSDFNPKTVYKLIMVVQPNGNYKEVARVTEFPTGETAPNVFDDLVVDYLDGAIQKFNGFSGVISNIVNGNEGSVITIYGNANEALEIESIVGKIVMTSLAVLSDETQFVTLRNFGGVWYDINRG